MFYIFVWNVKLFLYGEKLKFED